MVDVQRAMPDCCNSQTLHWSASSLPNNECSGLQSLDKILQEGPQNSLQALPPVCLLITTSHRCAFPLSVSAYCKQSKTGL